MRAPTLRNLYLITLGLIALLIGAILIGLDVPAVILLGAVVTLYLIAYMNALINLAELRQWTWFAVLWVCFLFPPWHFLALPAYIFAGPKEHAAQTVSQNHSASPHNLLDPGAPVGFLARFGQLSNPGALVSQPDHSAGWIVRAAAAALDIAFMLAIWIACYDVVGLIAILYFGDAVFVVTLVALFLGLFIVLVSFPFVIWPVQWSSNGQTFGQRVMNIKVVSESGRPLRFGMALIRSICMIYLDTIFFGIPIGWFWLLIDPKGQTWHDKIASTIIIRTQSTQVPELYARLRTRRRRFWLAMTAILAITLMIGSLLLINLLLPERMEPGDQGYNGYWALVGVFLLGSLIQLLASVWTTLDVLRLNYLRWAIVLIVLSTTALLIGLSFASFFALVLGLISLTGGFISQSSMVRLDDLSQLPIFMLQLLFFLAPSIVPSIAILIYATRPPREPEITTDDAFRDPGSTEAAQHIGS